MPQAKKANGCVVPKVGRSLFLLRKVRYPAEKGSEGWGNTITEGQPDSWANFGKLS